jgi:MFS family permease
MTLQLHWRSLVRSLAYRNFRLFFVGQGVSLIGTWMQQVALAWLVYRLTGSALLLGLVGCASQIPTLFLAPLAGVVTDRYNRRIVLVVTQSLIMVQAFVVAALVLGGMIDVWQIVALSFFAGLVNPFDVTTRQAFLRELVTHKEDLTNAVALNSALFNGACLVGPALAGLVISLAGEGTCFLINALSYLAVLAALLAMKLPQEQQHSTAPLGRGLSEGVHYTFGFAPVRSLLLLLALVNFVGAPYAVLLPIFATEVLHGGAHTFGFLTAATGLGALMAALYLASRQNLQGMGTRIALAPAAFGAGLIVFAFSRSVALSLAVLLVMGFAQLLQAAGSNALLQTLVEEDKRGRVMSFYTLSIVGIAPLGSLAAGVLADHIGASRTLLLGAPFCVLGSALFASQLPHLRRKAISALQARGEIVPQVEYPSADAARSAA